MLVLGAFQNRTPDDRGDSFSVETLLDALTVLYDECCSSSFKREKTVADFIETGTVRCGLS